MIIIYPNDRHGPMEFVEESKQTPTQIITDSLKGNVDFCSKIIQQTAIVVSKLAEKIKIRYWIKECVYPITSSSSVITRKRTLSWKRKMYLFEKFNGLIFYFSCSAIVTTK